jgi:hypothetical protein
MSIKVYHSFLTARHLALYAWYVYRFNTVAQLQAYASLEYALRERLGHADDDRPPGLRVLLTEAIDIGLLDERRIRDWPGHAGAIAPGYVSGDWLRRLPEPVAMLRNDLARGSFTLNPDGGLTLRIVADIINQLYRGGGGGT